MTNLHKPQRKFTDETPEWTPTGRGHMSNATLAEIRAMRDRGEIKAPQDDAPEIDLPDGFWDDAEIAAPMTAPTTQKGE